MVASTFDFLFLSNGFIAEAKRRGQKQKWARQAANLFREKGSADQWPLILGTVANALGVCLTPPSRPKLQIPAVYLGFFTRTFDFAISPHRGRRQLSEASGADGEAEAWQWIHDQLMEGVRNPDWLRRDSVAAIGIIFAQLFRRIGDCRLPILAGPTAAAQLFEMRRVVSDRRIPINQWNMDSPDAECREYYDVAKRNVGRARKRLGLERARIRAGNGADIREEKGNIAQEPSDRVLIPPVSN